MRYIPTDDDIELAKAALRRRVREMRGVDLELTHARFQLGVVEISVVMFPGRAGFLFGPDESGGPVHGLFSDVERESVARQIVEAYNAVRGQERRAVSAEELIVWINAEIDRTDRGGVCQACRVREPVHQLRVVNESGANWSPDLAARGECAECLPVVNAAIHAAQERFWLRPRAST